jgi:hypothetical protein
MRFSDAAILALPLLAAAAQQRSPLDHVKERAEYWFNMVSSFMPRPSTQHPIETTASKVASSSIDILSLNNWKSVLRSAVEPSSETPEEWFILITGGNKTCYGQCGKIETGFNESAAAFAVIPSAPHLAYVNCDYQPVLCNSWAAGPPSLWIMEVGAPGTPIDIYIVHLNTTTTTVETYTKLASSKSYKTGPKYEGYFHPFDGPIAKYGLATPLGYVFWFFALIPSWAMMIAISFLSRTIMYVIWN